MTGGRMGPPDAGERARMLSEARERARLSLQERWDDEAAERERFVLMFKADWAGCGDMMAVLGRFGADDMEWSHDPPLHRAEFSCTFATLKSMQAAALSTGVPRGLIHFQRAAPGGGEG